VRRRRAARPLRAAVVLLLVGPVAACGVPLQDSAEPLPNGALPSTTAPATPAPTIAEVDVYFVSGRALEPVPEPISRRTPEGIMQALAAAPPVSRQADLRTLLIDPLTGEPLLAVVSQAADGSVRVQRSDAFLELPATDQVLLIGQVVLSMAEVGVPSVEVVDAQGQAVPLALPDGRVNEGPVSAEDYRSLLAG